MSLLMTGQIDGVFVSIPATRTTKTGGYVDGIWVPGVGVTSPYIVNIQPASDREIDFVSRAGERIDDVRRVYVNEGDMQAIGLDGFWDFLDQKWKTVKCDNRYWRDYCKLIVVRLDDQ